MWFDPHAKLAEITLDGPTAQAHSGGVVSRLSQVSQPAIARNDVPRVASVAVVAMPRQPYLKSFPYGTACNLGDAPLSWTGRVVSLDEWRRLTQWDRHGPNGRHWSGITKQWEPPIGD